MINNNVGREVVVTWLLLILGISSCVGQPIDWLESWDSMPEDTHKIRFLHQQLREARSLSSDSLLLLATMGYEMADRLKDPRGMAAMDLYRGLGNAYQGKFNASANHFMQAVVLYEGLNDSKQAGAALTNLGLAYYSLGEEDQALASYLKAADHFARIQQPNSRLYNNIAIIFRKQKKYERAIEYYRQSLALRRAEQDSLGMAAVWFNLANLYLYQKDTTRAIGLAKQALQLYQQAGEEQNIAATHALLGSVYRRTQLSEAAKRELDAAWNWYGQHQQGGYFLTCVSELAHLYASHEEWQKANGFYQQAITTAYEQQAKEELYGLLRSYSKVLDQLGLSKAAYDSLNRSYLIREKLTETQRLALTEEMQARFEVQQAEQREQMQSRHFRKQQQQSQLILLLVGALLIGALAFLWVNVQKNRRLHTKQQQVEEALQAKEAIMREMHHRVKNNLQFLSSLLRLQARHLEDQQAQEALLHSRSRVLSMALIHNHLYEEEGRTAIKMDAYLDKLTTDVLGTMQVPDKQIQLKLKVEPMIMDVDQAVPVALITHEAMVNAMKYAFTAKREGYLTISLHAMEKTGQAQLMIMDDGIGLQDQPQGFGQRLMKLMAERLKGSLQMFTDSGCQIVLDFPFNSDLYVNN